MKTIQPVSHYLELLENLRINPNFYVSEPYLNISRATCFEEDGWCWIEADGWCLFPPLQLCPFKDFPKKKIWSNFDDVKNTYEVWINGFTGQFLDLEYIYDPKRFLDLKGGLWATFRKNINKWPREHENWIYYDHLDWFAGGVLIAEWLNNKSETVQDAHLLTQFCYLSDDPNIHRRCLYDEYENLVAINVWDENYKFINYRFCIVKQDVPYLDEFARWLFYTDSEIQRSGKLINDGGVLGSEGLERYKDKLNPLHKRKVFSWIKK